jgi:DNA-binding HxlR family transcriptional regulator
MTARTLEVVGERWSLLIVRDLILGPRRFTDLMRSLGGITPTRLTGRLRGLEAAGIVAREPATSGREVWYRLTDAGRDLAPVVGELALWGVEHALDPPQQGEPVHSDHVMLATRFWLQRRGERPPGATTWVWRFPDEYAYTLKAGRDGWTLARGEPERAKVTVATTPQAWARFLTESEPRRLAADDVDLVATPTAARVFARAFGATLDPS